MEGRDTKARCGIVGVDDSISERRLRRILPPGHQILAVRREPHKNRTDYLIEDVSLPEASVSEPPKVIAFFTMMATDGERLKLIGQWVNGVSWVVGEWPSLTAYVAEMHALDG